MAIALAILALTFMGFAGYTVALQRLFRTLMERGGAEDVATFRREAVVLLRVYLAKLNVAFLGGLIVYAVARDNADWQSGALLVLLCILGGRLIASSWFQPRTAWLLTTVAAELARWGGYYHRRGKTVQEQAVEALLARISALKRDLMWRRQDRT